MITLRLVDLYLLLVVDQALVVHVVLDSVPHLIVIQEQLGLLLNQLLLILLDHPLIKPISFRQYVIRHAFLILYHLPLLDLVHYPHLQLTFEGFHSHFGLALVRAFDGFTLIFDFEVEVVVVFLPLLGFGGE